MATIIRNPAAYAAAIARNQRLQQQQNVSAMQQNGVQGVTDQQLIQIMLQQAAMKQQAPDPSTDSAVGAYQYIFGKDQALQPTVRRKSAYEELNIGNEE